MKLGHLLFILGGIFALISIFINNMILLPITIILWFVAPITLLPEEELTK